MPRLQLYPRTITDQTFTPITIQQVTTHTGADVRTNEVYIYKLLLSSSGAHDAGSGGRAGTKSGEARERQVDKVLGPGQIYDRFRKV